MSVAAASPTPPVVSVASRITAPGQTFAASSLFIATDADGDTIAKIALWDT
jgi:hypothetical protein